MTVVSRAKAITRGGQSMDNNSLSHTKWNCIYHIVFIPKYRRKALHRNVKSDMKEILAALCEYKKVEIVSGAICSDHVHMCLKIPPKISVSEFMGYLKGKSALMIFEKHPEDRRGDRHFWARGYYVDTVGLNEEQIKKYINDQEASEQINKK
jgi:putative transposase